nr:anti-sigma-D factor RsdA [Amycolatopsis anabasis]
MPTPAEEHSGDAEATFAADLSAVQADDALLDALGGSDPKIADGLGDQELNALLLAWRRDIDSEPLAELVDTETAVTTVKTAALARRHGLRGRKRRMLVPVAAAAAVLAIAFTGTGLAARDAQPGDTLWGLTKVLYADHARSVEAAAAVRSDLNAALLAIGQRDFEAARKALDAAQAALKQVASEDNLDELMKQHRELSAMLQNPGQQPSPPPQVNPPAQGSSAGPLPTPAPNPSNPTDGSGSTALPPSTSDNPTPPSSSTTPPPTSSSIPSGSGGQGTEPGTVPRGDPPAEAPPPGAASVPTN